MDELPAHAKAVLRRAQEHDACTDEEARRRVRAGVARAVGASVLPASALEPSRAHAAQPWARAEAPRAPTVRSRAAEPGASATMSGKPLLGLAGKLTATTALVALVGTGIAMRQRATESREPLDGRAPAAVSVPLLAPPDPARAGSLDAAPRAQHDGPAPIVARASDSALRSSQRGARRAVAVPGSRADEPRGSTSRDASLARPRARPDTLDAEVALMRQLGAAVSRRDTAEAERVLAQHQARFDQPALLEERHGFVALVRCMGHSPNALVSSRAFVARYPNSVLTARVQQECEPEGR